MAKERQKLSDRFLNVVERVGNKLPHPVTLFFMFAGIVLVLSYLLSLMDITAVHPGTGDEISIVNLLNKEGIRRVFTEAVSNFTGFAPLGTVLVAMLGVGVAEKSGLIGTMLRKLVLGAPDKLITAVVVFAGVMSSMASDAGYIVLVPLGAIIFVAKGRHPLAGLAAAFAGVSGGFSSNLLVTMLDPLLIGFTEAAAHMLDDTYQVLPTANYYFMIFSTFLITIVGTVVTEKIVEPRLGVYTGEYKEELTEIDEKEGKGLVAAGIGLFLFVAAVAAMLIPANGILRADEGYIIDGFPPSPFVSSMVFLIALMFFVPGLFYGKAAGTIKSDKDVAQFMGDAMASMGGYIVLAFAAAQFIEYFSWSQIGLVMAIKGADFLQAVGLQGIPLILGFVLVSGFINIFIGSASAKWAIMAPVFVPMLMQMGYSPELTQLAYRIGDSVTNIISPLMSYFAIIVAFAKKYDKDVGLGTLISTMLPYSIAFTVVWMIALTVWLLLGIPIGPSAPVDYIF
jgi:aminobenzoyl-glutamate transport protein